MSGAKSTPSELRRIRRAQQHACWGRLIIAPLWVAYGANLGTLLRTCDALGGKRPHIHWVQPSKVVWLEAQRKAGYRLVAAGVGSSLNVAVAGSLVAYRLAGLA